MKPKLLLLVPVFACSALISLATPALTEEIASETVAEGAPGNVQPRGVAMAAPADCPAAKAGDTQPILLSSCSVQVECDDGSVVACSGNSSCSTGGAHNRCVICDGVQQGCCPKTCCEVCREDYEYCLTGCGNPVPPCRICKTIYDICVDSCTGGCP